MSAQFDVDVLDRPGDLDAGDPGGMLRDTASSGAQVRQALSMLSDHTAELSHLVAGGRPRAIVVAGMGGSAMAGDVAAGVAGIGAPLPIITLRGYTLPGWVNALDLVVAVSFSGETEETREVFAEAERRGARLVVVANAASSLADAARDVGALILPVDGGGRAPRASMWALAVPVLAVLHAFDITGVDAAALNRVADLLDSTSAECGVGVSTDVNPAKQTALELAPALPMIWGTTSLGAVASYRFMAQLAENADVPSVHGELPEANHNQVVTLDGHFAQHPDGDLFVDRVDGAAAPAALRLFLLRDSDEHPQVAKRAAVSQALAQERSVPVSVLDVQAGTPLERFAALVQRIDFATVYLALGLGVDPSGIAPITALKERIAQ